MKNTNNRHSCRQARQLIPIFLLAAITWLAPVHGLAQALDFDARTPGSRLMAQGNNAYQARQYPTAMANFIRAAYWADKLAQHNVGVMYYKGQGVERDPAHAWAWFELAAERRYPHLSAIADQVYLELDEAAQQRGRAILESELLGEYGDEVAVPRTARRMARDRRSTAGSRVGAVGALRVIDVDPNGSARLSYDRGMIVMEYYGTEHGGDQFFANPLWDFHQVIETEAVVFDAVARGQVKLRDVQAIDD
jgi:TPR repeat protein